MKTQRWKRLAALVFALLLALPSTVSAAETPTASSNINKQDYATYGTPVKSYLYENSKGGVTRVEYINSKVVVEDYDSAYNLTASRTIQPELPIWGGFFAGKDANYLIYGQENKSESTSAEVIRVVKYSTDWQKLGSTSIKGAYTMTPFDGGSLRCAEENGYLYVHCARKMVKQFMTMYGPMSDGQNHQTNLLFEIRESDMTLVDMYDQVWNVDFGYVSHAFNQFILIDQDKNIVTLNHADSDTEANGKAHYGVAQKTQGRGVDLIRYDEKAGQDHFQGKNQWQWTTFTLVQGFGGSSGNNTTGASIGGFAETSSSYISAFSYDGKGTSATAARDIYLGVTSKSGLTSKSTKISTASGVTTPQLVSTGLSGGWVMWNGKSGSTPNDTLYYTAYTAAGASGSVKTATAPLSDCQPISYNGKAVWYVTNNSAPTFYGLDASGVTVLGGADPKAGSTATTPSDPTTTTPSNPSTTTPSNPSTTTPSNPSTTTPSNPAASGSSSTTLLSDGNSLISECAAVMADGSLKAWEHSVNIKGKQYETSYDLATVATNVKAVMDIFVLKNDGTLYLLDSPGEFGTMMKIADGVKQISYDVYLKNDGTVWGQTPLAKPGDKSSDGMPYDNFSKITDNAKQVYGGYFNEGYYYVLKNDGSLWSWGEFYTNSAPNPMLGRSNGTNQGSLLKVMDDVAYVTGGMAIKTDGSLWCWGEYPGNGSDLAYAPVKVLDNVVGAWLGGIDTMRFAVTKDGTLYSWGYNSSGMLGYEGGNQSYASDFGPAYCQTTPKKVSLDNVCSVYSSGFSTIVQKKDGSLWAIGRVTRLTDSGESNGAETFKKILDGTKVLSGASTSSTSTPNTTVPATPDTTPPSSSGTTSASSGTTSNPSTAQPSGTTSDTPFVDVPKGSEFYYAVLSAVNNGITTGVTPTEFRPYDTCTRGQVATFLWRDNGCPEPKTTVNPFKDVSSSSPFYKAILWAYENGITTGTSATTFNPGGTCTEGHILTFIWRAKGEPVIGESSHPYANNGKYYSQAIAWADNVGDGGMIGSAYNPETLASRGSVVNWLYWT